MRSMLEIVVGDEHRLVIAAESQDNEMIGWLHLTITRPLVTQPAFNVAGLVADKRFRRHGVGRALMHEAEASTLPCGLNSVSFRSNIVRAGAHTFYERLGYERVKIQHAYRKHLHP